MVVISEAGRLRSDGISLGWLVSSLSSLPWSVTLCPVAESLKGTLLLLLLLLEDDADVGVDAKDVGWMPFPVSIGLLPLVLAVELLVLALLVLVLPLDPNG